jgi:hypothetical protein
VSDARWKENNSGELYSASTRRSGVEGTAYQQLGHATRVARQLPQRHGRRVRGVSLLLRRLAGDRRRTVSSVLETGDARTVS